MRCLFHFFFAKAAVTKCHFIHIPHSYAYFCSLPYPEKREPLRFSFVLFLIYAPRVENSLAGLKMVAIMMSVMVTS